MARGEHIYVHGRFAGIAFEHHGIDMGDGTVIHLAPQDGARVTFADDGQRFCVRRDSWDQFCKGQTPQKITHVNALPEADIAAFAEASLGKCGYHLLDNNCEHFANLCCTGQAVSRQVELSHQAVASGLSLATKLAWALAARLSAKSAIQTVTRAAIKSNPLLLLADGAELVCLAVSCRAGLSAERSRDVARLSGSLVAAGVGGVVAGPGGALASLAVHHGSTRLAEEACGQLRKLISNG